jgi:hypothetical protein
VVLILTWVAGLFIVRGGFLNQDYQLVINTLTTIITFLMVALLQNSQTRSDQAVQHKLNAIADGLADLMTHTHNCNPGTQLGTDVAELKAAVGLESHESTSRRSHS